MGAKNEFEVDPEVGTPTGKSFPDADCPAACISPFTVSVVKSFASDISAFPHSQSQVVQSGYDNIGNPILGKLLIGIKYAMVNAINAKDKPTLNTIPNIWTITLNITPILKIGPPGIATAACSKIEFIESIPSLIAIYPKYTPKTISRYFNTGHIHAMKWATNNKTIIGNTNIDINRLKIKNRKSKFLIISLTGNVLTVDLQVLLSISFIPKCFALPIPFLYLSKNIAVV